MTRLALLFSGVTQSYGSRTALKDVTFNVAAGESHAIVGVNGAGKTTLFKCLLDFCSLQSGRIEIFGLVHLSPPSREPLAFLPEKFNPPYYLNGSEFIRYSLNLHRMPYGAAEVETMLTDMDMDRAALGLSVREYSKGMTQKLGLAACLLTKRSLYVLDEPMTGLDPKARMLLKNKLISLKQQGATLLFSSHSLPDVGVLCDKLTVLHEGQVRFTGTPDAFRTAFSAEDLERAFLNCID
ncbi:MAG: ABC transporter ATP-binding protein [Burkholderiales bacterium]